MFLFQTIPKKEIYQTNIYVSRFSSWFHSNTSLMEHYWYVCKFLTKMTHFHKPYYEFYAIGSCPPSSTIFSSLHLIITTTCSMHNVVRCARMDDDFWLKEWVTLIDMPQHLNATQHSGMFLVAAKGWWNSVTKTTWRSTCYFSAASWTTAVE